MQKTPLKYPMLYGFPLIPYPCTSPQSPQLRYTHSSQNTDNQGKHPKSVKFQKDTLFCMVSNHSQFGTSDSSQSQEMLPDQSASCPIFHEPHESVSPSLSILPL